MAEAGKEYGRGVVLNPGGAMKPVAFLIFIFLFACSKGMAGTLSFKQLMVLADHEVVSLGGDPSQMTAYVDMFSLDKSMVTQVSVWNAIVNKRAKSTLWEIHYMPKERVFDGEFFVLIDKKSGGVFATWDMEHGIVLKGALE